MNILYTGLFRFPNYDAAAARVLNIAKLLKFLGHSVYFLSWGGKERRNDLFNNTYIYQDFEYKVTNDIDCSSIQKKILNKLFQGRTAYSLIKYSIEDYDVVITYNTPLLFNIKLNRLCEAKGKKVILDLTEWYAPEEQLGGIFSPFYWLNELNMKVYNNVIKNKILISKYLDFYYKNQHNLQLPPLVDLNERKWNACLESNKLLSDYEGVTFIYAGFISYKDRIDLFIDAVYDLVQLGEKIRFIVLGTTIEQVPLKMRSKIDQLGDNVVFLGRISQDLVPSYYQLADFSVLLRYRSRKNMAGFPTKSVESLAAGVPILMNECSNITDYISDGGSCIVIESLMKEDIIKGIKRCISMKCIDAKMKMNARLDAQRYFHYSSWDNEMKNFLSELI